MIDRPCSFLHSLKCPNFMDGGNDAPEDLQHKYFKWLICLEGQNHWLTHGTKRLWKLCRFYSGIFCIALDTSIYDDTVSGAGGGDSNREARIPVTGFSTPSMSSVWICFTNCQCPATLKESSASQSLWRNRDRYYENILTEQLRTTCSLKPSYSTHCRKISKSFPPNVHLWLHWVHRHEK